MKLKITEPTAEEADRVLTMVEEQFKAKKTKKIAMRHNRNGCDQDLQTQRVEIYGPILALFA